MNRGVGSEEVIRIPTTSRTGARPGPCGKGDLGQRVDRIVSEKEGERIETGIEVALAKNEMETGHRSFFS